MFMDVLWRLESMDKKKISTHLISIQIVYVKIQ